jgi:cytochrome P450
MFTPTGITNKWTVTDQPITFDGCTYVIPQGTRISISGVAVHQNPKVWGENAAEWEPSRWIIEDDGGGDPMPSRPNGKSENDAHSPLHSLSAVQQKQPSGSPSTASAINFGTASAQGLLIPAKGSFLAFSEGARACLGKRVATVEFVAVISTLLRRHRVELEDDWSVERVKKVLGGRKAGALTMQPPEPIPLRFVRR